MLASSVRALSLLTLGCAASCAAHAHDTWLERLPQSTAQQPALRLVTGDHFPMVDSAHTEEQLARSGCQVAGTPSGPLVRQPDGSMASTPVRLAPAQNLPRAPRLSCWAQLRALALTLSDEQVEQYFEEARPPAAVRQAWQAQRALGKPWRERYIKHARLEWFIDAHTVSADPPQASGLGLDALLLSPLQAPRVGQELEFLVIKGGAPLAQFPVEFRHEGSRLGLWRRTDALGRVRVSPPAQGRWLLRGIEITPPAAAEPDPIWQGLFITVAFDVEPPRR